ncbi:MAG: ribbon-helix-helix domain-containing protein [Candidatus Micrarchaeia archaeon]|jgi:Arc/MetJ-type ribon-helix-helix transcriptional regulator
MAVVNLHLDGELMEFMNEYIKRGYAASKSEVLRAGLRELMVKLPNADEERRGWSELSSKSLRRLWDNPKDEKAWKKY